MIAARRVGALTAVAMHALALAALLSYEPARKALLAAAPIMVELIAPPRIEPPAPQPPAELPKPRPLMKRPMERPTEAQLVAAPVDVPSPAAVAAPPPAPAPIEAVAAPAPSVPLTQPIFNADYLDNPAPLYPALSRRQGEQGRVILRVLVTAGGSADEVQVRTSSGHPRLDEAARATVRAWKFVPAKRGDQAVPAWVLIPISFRLEG